MPAWIWVSLVLLGIECGPGEDRSRPRVAAAEAEDRPLSVFVVNYPLQYFAQRIGGSHVEVSLPVPSGVDPAYWSPGPETIGAYQKADLVLLNGAGYAKWVELVSLPQAKLVDTSAAFRDRYVPLAGGSVHTHGPEGEHSHAGFAFTTWLDPMLAIEHARAIAAAFSRVRPERTQAFQRALAELETDLNDLDRLLAATWSLLDDEPVLFSHPVYQYLARRYGLNARSVHWEPDQMPDEAQWQELGAMHQEQPASWMIWEDMPLPKTRQRLESLGIRSAVVDPCAGTPPEDDYLSVMRKNLEALRRVYSTDSPLGAG